MYFLRTMYYRNGLYELPKKQQINFFMYGSKEIKKTCLTPGY